MKKHTYLFFLSCVLSLSLLAGSIFYGGNVKAASPIFYDTNFVFYAADYSTYGGTGDFSYTSKSFGNTFSSSGEIYNELGAYLGTSSGSSPMTSNGFRITVSSPELFLNGGYIKIGYIFAFLEFGSYDYSNYKNGFTNTSLRSSYIDFSAPGYISYSTSGLTDYRSFTFSYRNNSNTALVGNDYGYVENAIVNGFDRYDSSNLPVGAGILGVGSTSQLLDSYGISYSKFYNYGRPGDNWWKSYVYELTIKIEPLPSQLQNYEVAIYPSQNIGTYSYSSYDYSSTISVGDETESIVLKYIPRVFICPIYCYSISTSSYAPIQQLLTDLKGDTSAMTYYLFQLSNSPTSEQQAWLNEYQRKSQDAIAQASSMAAAAHYDFSKPDIDSGDLSQYINGTEVRPFTTLLSSFLSHSKILIILTVAITASIIGYIFFGKRG